MDTSIVIPINANTPLPAARDACDASASGISSDVSRPADFVTASLTAAPDLFPETVPFAAEREVARLRMRIRELAAELVHAQEAARRHLARELHDGVGAELTATRFALASVDTWLPADAPAQCAAALSVANRSLDDVCEATRRAVAELHGPQLDVGIVGALSQWVGDFAERTGLRTSLVCAADVRLTRLSTDAALAVFRVAQEALNNVAKHAQASGADVRLETTRRHLRLVVSDDGVGLSARANQRGGQRGCFGIAGMRARCEAFDGKLRVSAGKDDRGSKIKAGRGTTVSARFAWDAMLTAAPLVARRFQSS
jgi:signal transduction histidine kinase